MNFEVLYKDEANRGERIALKFRWILVLIVFILIVFVTIKGDYKEAIKSSIIAALYGIYNLYLIYLFRKNKVYPWIRYLSVSIDIGLLSIHIYTLSVFVSPMAVATTATLYLFPVFMFLSVLRYDKKLILYTVIYALVWFNLIYILRYPSLDKTLISKVISTDPLGQFYKTVYLFFFGALLFHIPNIVNRLISRYNESMEEKNRSEINLALEKQEREFTDQKLQYEKEINSSLNERNQRIEIQNQKLIELNATKDRLFSIIGHDLKNPFSVILSISQVLHDEFENLSKEDFKTSLNILNNTTRQGVNLLDNLLDWARSQSGRIKYQPELLILNPAISNIASQMHVTLQKKEIRVLNNIDPALEIYADRNMFNTIVRNILSNAIKFSYQSGEVSIDAWKNEDMNLVEIIISDQGVGISEENIDKLFRIQTHLSTYGTMQEGGTGLGLIVCKDFIEQHGGSIRVRSAPDKGCDVIFTFPNKRINEV